MKAPNDGVVILVDDQFYSGISVVLDHGQGIHTMFFHLSQAKVKYGQAVRKGDVIALVGSTGRSRETTSTGACASRAPRWTLIRPLKDRTPNN